MLSLYDFKEMAINKHHISILALCIYLLTICILCFASPTNIPDTPFDLWGLPIDKVVHFLMFLPFPILAFLSFISPRYGIFKEFLLIIVIFGIGCSIAIGTEYIQKFTGYRSFEVKDILADIAGLIAGSALTLGYITLKHYIRNDK